MDVNQFGEMPFLYPQQMLCYGSEIAAIPQTKLQLKKALGISNHLSCGVHWQTLFTILS